MGASGDLGSLRMRIEFPLTGFAMQMSKAKGMVKDFGGAIVKDLAKAQDGLSTLGMAFGAVSAGIGIAAGIAIKQTSDFQHQMAEVSTIITKDSEKWTAKLSKDVIELSRTMPRSTDLLTRGLYDLLSAMIPVEDSMTALKLSTKAAVAGLTDVQSATKLGASTMNGLGKAAGTMQEIFDTAFETVRIGVITFPELASVMGQVIPSASKLGVSMKEMYGSMAFLTKTGLDAAEASISLARAFDQIIEKRPALEGLGVKIFGSKGEFLGFRVVMEQIAKLTAGLTAEKRANIFEEMGFDIRAARAITNISMNLKGFTDDLESITKSSGALDVAYNKMAVTTTEKTQILKNNVKALGIEFGETLLPAVNLSLGALTKLTQVMGDLPKPLQSVVTYGGLTVGAIAAIGSTALLAASQLPNIVKGLMGFKDALETARIAQMIYLGSASKFIAMAGPYALAAAAIAGGIFLIVEQTKKARKETQALTIQALINQFHAGKLSATEFKASLEGIGITVDNLKEFGLSGMEHILKFSEAIDKAGKGVDFLKEKLSLSDVQGIGKISLGTPSIDWKTLEDEFAKFTDITSAGFNMSQAEQLKWWQAKLGLPLTDTARRAVTNTVNKLNADVLNAQAEYQKTFESKLKTLNDMMGISGADKDKIQQQINELYSQQIQDYQSANADKLDALNDFYEASDKFRQEDIDTEKIYWSLIDEINKAGISDLAKTALAGLNLSGVARNKLLGSLLESAKTLATSQGEETYNAISLFGELTKEQSDAIFKESHKIANDTAKDLAETYSTAFEGLSAFLETPKEYLDKDEKILIEYWKIVSDLNKAGIFDVAVSAAKALNISGDALNQFLASYLVSFKRLADEAGSIAADAFSLFGEVSQSEADRIKQDSVNITLDQRAQILSILSGMTVDKKTALDAQRKAIIEYYDKAIKLLRSNSVSTVALEKEKANELKKIDKDMWGDRLKQTENAFDKLHDMVDLGIDLYRALADIPEMGSMEDWASQIKSVSQDITDIAKDTADRLVEAQKSYEERIADVKKGSQLGETISDRLIREQKEREDLIQIEKDYQKELKTIEEDRIKAETKQKEDERLLIRDFQISQLSDADQQRIAIENNYESLTAIYKKHGLDTVQLEKDRVKAIKDIAITEFTDRVDRWMQYAEDVIGIVGIIKSAYEGAQKLGIFGKGAKASEELAGALPEAGGTTATGAKGILPKVAVGLTLVDIGYEMWKAKTESDKYWAELQQIKADYLEDLQKQVGSGVKTQAESGLVMYEKEYSTMKPDSYLYIGGKRYNKAELGKYIEEYKTKHNLDNTFATASFGSIKSTPSTATASLAPSQINISVMPTDVNVVYQKIAKFLQQGGYLVKPKSF